MKILKLFLSALLALLGAYLIVATCLWFRSAKPMFYQPSAQKLDLVPILTQESFSDEDYALLLQQTGLYPPVIDELSQTEDFIDQMLLFQANYLSDVPVQRTNMNILTRIDRVLDASGNSQKVFKLAPYHNGYIFFTRSTYTSNWRHGHAGIVIDEVRGKVLESLEPGTLSMEQNAHLWEYYPTFKMMRLKDTPQEKLDEIAQYAHQNLVGIPYNILVMKNAATTFTSTHCSFIVWQAFKAFGIDLDTTGGIFVSPRDISASPYLEPLQIFGFDPEKEW